MISISWTRKRESREHTKNGSKGKQLKHRTTTTTHRLPTGTVGASSKSRASWQKVESEVLRPTPGSLSPARTIVAAAVLSDSSCCRCGFCWFFSASSSADYALRRCDRQRKGMRCSVRIFILITSHRAIPMFIGNTVTFLYD